MPLTEPDATLTTEHAQQRPLWACSIIGALSGIPVALLATACAQLVVAVAALFIAAIVTRDWYVILFATSFGPQAATLILVASMLAIILWGAGSPFVKIVSHPWHIPVAAVCGILATAGGFYGAPLLEMTIPLSRSNSLPLPHPLFDCVTLVSGLLSGLLAVLYHPPVNILQSRWQPFIILFLYAIALAFLLESSAALMIALGLI
jgi:hypothetical protein